MWFGLAFGIIPQRYAASDLLVHAAEGELLDKHIDVASDILYFALLWLSFLLHEFKY